MEVYKTTFTWGKGSMQKSSFISANLNILREVIQIAVQVWPTHAWIFHTHSIDDITVVDKHIHFSISSLNGMFFSLL